MVDTKVVANHWNAYYRSKGVPTLPSQFAVFVLNEFRPAGIIDIGCGSGRDSFYFAHQSIPTIGIDGSASAIALCQSSAVHADRLEFRRHDINDADLSTITASTLEGWDISGPILVYARFFVHAIDDAGERELLRHARRLLESFGGIFAVEFRTTRDKSMQKVTPDHYRRFVSPADFAARAMSYQLRVDYSVEGFGMAKFKEDDAHVARMILSLYG